MLMLLRYQNGERFEAVPLAADGTSMRVAPRDHMDALELRLFEGQWYDEEGCVVEIDAITTDGECNPAEICFRLLPRTYQAVG